jgi:hypothetical protein
VLSNWIHSVYPTKGETMSHTVAHIKILRQVYNRGDHFVIGWLVEINRDGKKRIYLHASEIWRKWLEEHTGTYIFGDDDRFYPANAMNKFGMPAVFAKGNYD